MTGLSKMISSTRSIATSAVKSNLFNKTSSLNSQVLLSQSRGSHGRTMFIRPGKFYTKKYMDLIHFHTCLSIIPFAAFMGYQYLFNGPGELTEAPADYEPRHYEYHRNPIRRFLAKYVFEVPEQAYEEHLHFVYREQCKQKMRSLEEKVRDQMLQKQDYKAWYYVPVTKEGKIQKEKYMEDFGRQGYDAQFGSKKWTNAKN